MSSDDTKPDTDKLDAENIDIAILYTTVGLLWEAEVKEEYTYYTQEEFEAFAESDLPFNSDGMLDYKEDVVDVWDWMVRTHGR